MIGNDRHAQSPAMKYVFQVVAGHIRVRHRWCRHLVLSDSGRKADLPHIGSPVNEFAPSGQSTLIHRINRSKALWTALSRAGVWVNRFPDSIESTCRSLSVVTGNAPCVPAPNAEMTNGRGPKSTENQVRVDIHRSGFRQRKLNFVNPRSNLVTVIWFASRISSEKYFTRGIGVNRKLHGEVRFIVWFSDGVRCHGPSQDSCQLVVDPLKRSV